MTSPFDSQSAGPDPNAPIQSQFVGVDAPAPTNPPPADPAAPQASQAPYPGAYPPGANWPNMLAYPMAPTISPTGVAPYPPYPSQPFPLPPAPPPRRRRAGWIILSSLLAVVVVAGITLGGIALFRPGLLSGAVGGVRRAAPSPTVTPALPVLFSDTLLANINGWTNDPRGCFFSGEAYHVKNGVSCFAPTPPIGQGQETISVQATTVSSGASGFYGIQFWQQPTLKLTCYAFIVNAAGQWAFYKTVNDKDTLLAPFTSNTAIKTGVGATNALTVRAVAGHIELFANGVDLGHVDDSTFTQGLTGLISGSSAEVAFTNLVIRGPGDLTPPPPPQSNPGSVFSDPLTSDLGNLPPGSDFESDGFHDSGYYISPYGYNTPSDVVMQVTALRQTGGPDDAVGLAFHHTSAGHAYGFVVTTSGSALFVKFADSQIFILAEFHPGVLMRRGVGASNTLEAQVIGSQFTFYINGAKVGSAHDTAYGAGQVGLIVLGGQVVFSHLYLD
ncbi:MAG TPA: hypothetical protein VF808_12615 [Ktedonobacterales bacterium]